MFPCRHAVQPLRSARVYNVARNGRRFASRGPPQKTRRPKIESTRPQDVPRNPLRQHVPPRRQAAPLPPPSSPKPSQIQRIKFFPSRIAAVIFGGLALTSGFYVFSLVKSISILSSQSAEVDIDPSAPTAQTYDHIAPYFDSQVSSVEFWLGLSKLRKQMVEKAYGDVLEVGVGTGRNHEYYNLKQCTSITMIDPSENMIALASVKWNGRRLLPEWKETAPDGTRRVNFKIMDATGDIAPPARPGVGQGSNRGFTTIVSSFTLCSIPKPAEALAHLCKLLSRSSPAQEPRVLLLEHGQSSYEWLNTLLDNSAPAHAAQHGCWWNRDVGAIAEEAASKADMEIVSLRRRHFGTTWIVEMRPKPVRNTQASDSSVSEAAPKMTADADSKGWWTFWR